MSLSPKGWQLAVRVARVNPEKDDRWFMVRFPGLSYNDVRELRRQARFVKVD